MKKYNFYMKGFYTLYTLFIFKLLHASRIWNLLKLYVVAEVKWYSSFRVIKEITIFIESGFEVSDITSFEHFN